MSAAEEVVLNDGVAHLTLDSAAAQAGISKGGVLYHFPTRAALISAMVERLGASFDADLERAGGSGGEPGDFTRAYVAATFAPLPDESALRERRLGAAVIAGVASDAHLLEPLRERFASWQRSIEHDGIGSEVASLVRLASDGLWFCELLGLGTISEELRANVRSALEALCGEALGSRDDRDAARTSHKGEPGAASKKKSAPSPARKASRP